MYNCYKSFFAFLILLAAAGYSKADAQDLADPVFSHEAGFYTQDFELHITHPDPDAELYYTLDGSTPTEDSNHYENPIVITDRSPEPNLLSSIPTNNITDGPLAWREPGENIRKATIVRVKAFTPGSVSSTVTQTYFVFDSGADAYELSVISIATDSLNLFGFDEGIYVPGVNYEEGDDGTGNYFQRGEEWERPASFELFEQDGSPGHKQDIGIRIHGGFTRRFALKSLRLYARSAYGENRFNYRMFPESEYESYNRFILRNSGNDFGLTMFMDAAAQSLIRHFNVDTQAYRPAIVFLNGEYWGIQNVRERYDRRYLERVYGADPDNVDYMHGHLGVSEGDWDHYLAMLEFIEQQDLSDQTNFDHVQTLMDVDNFLDYYSAQIYYGNSDWPQNNIDFWRSRVDYNPNAPVGLDGRWRWLLYDVDRSLGYFTDAEFDMIRRVLRNHWSTVIIRNLLENDQFKTQFINRISDHLNTAFIAERVSSVIDSLRQPLEPVIDEHIARWRNHQNRSVWESWIDQMHTYAEERPANLRRHLMDHFDTGEEVELTVGLQSPPRGYVKVNSTEILPSTPGAGAEPYPWTGIYFSDIPITLKAVSGEGYRFDHWTSIGPMPDELNPQEAEIEFNLTEAVTLIPNFIPEDDQERIIHYWVFTDDLPNDTPLEIIDPVYSALPDGRLQYVAAISPYPPPGGSAGILDRVNDPTDINYISSANADIPYEQSDMRGIRARNPSLVDDRESSLIFHVPTTGFSDPEFTFAAVRTANGQRELRFDYSVGPAEDNWESTGLENPTATLFEAYKQISLSFEGIEEAHNNPYFRIRIRFDGDEVIRKDDNGNVRFNNVSLTGREFDFEDPDDTMLPGEAALYQNYPNPFNGLTIIPFDLMDQQHVRIEIFNSVGQRIAVAADEIRSAGTHRVSFNGSGLASGIYFYRLQAGSFELSKRMTLIK